MPTLDDMKRMADKQAEPLLAKLKTDPKNVDLLNKIALTYKAAHQFNDAISYFQKALDVDPKNVAIRTDMASCMYYTGDVDGALAELDKSLTYDPKHPGTLMNIGIIKWQGKNDVPGAVAAWQKLLKLNPNFPQKAVIEHMIAQAQQQKNTAQVFEPTKGISEDLFRTGQAMSNATLEAVAASPEAEATSRPKYETWLADGLWRGHFSLPFGVVSCGAGAVVDG